MDLEQATALRDRLDRLEQVAQAMESAGWRLWEVRVEFDRVPCEGVSVEIIAGARVLVDEEEGVVQYTLTLRPGRWSHYVEGFGSEFGVSRNTPPFNVPHPQSAARLLVRDRERGLEFERAEEEWAAYQELKAECGPGEEPDPREVHKFLQKERERWAQPPSSPKDEYFVVNLGGETGKSPS